MCPRLLDHLRDALRGDDQEAVFLAEEVLKGCFLIHELSILYIQLFQDPAISPQNSGQILGVHVPVSDALPHQEDEFTCMIDELVAVHPLILLALEVNAPLQSRREAA